MIFYGNSYDLRCTRHQQHQQQSILNNKAHTNLSINQIGMKSMCEWFIWPLSLTYNAYSCSNYCFCYNFMKRFVVYINGDFKFNSLYFGLDAHGHRMPNLSDMHCTIWFIFIWLALSHCSKLIETKWMKKKQTDIRIKRLNESRVRFCQVQTVYGCVCVRACVNDVKSQRTMNVALSFDWNGIELNWICEWKRSILKRSFAPCRYVYPSHMCITKEKRVWSQEKQKNKMCQFSRISHWHIK